MTVLKDKQQSYKPPLELLLSKPVKGSPYISFERYVIFNSINCYGNQAINIEVTNSLTKFITSFIKFV